MPIPSSMARARATGRNSTISAASPAGIPAFSSSPRTADGPSRGWAAKTGTASRIASRTVIAFLDLGGRWGLLGQEVHELLEVYDPADLPGQVLHPEYDLDRVLGPALPGRRRHPGP